ncbi:MAG: outer membrane lipoprotein-sorting protein [Halobacteriovoraceae bacterium]|nr:outer membrane lipoprotein-sorting protein [Halobacteriovoraceae bacterium]
MIKCLIIGLLGLALTTTAYAESAEAKGLRLAKELEKANDGYRGEKGTMTLTLIDAYKSKTIRKMKGLTKEVKGDGDLSLSIFLNPKDVKGTKMLTHSHKKNDDDQWLYLPSVRRVKRITSRSKASSFMGSEFSYEDLGSQEIEKYKYKWLKNSKTKKGDTVWVLERIPRKKSGYSKQVLYIKAKIHNPIKIEYYDKKKELLKKSTFKKYRGYKIGKKTIYRPTTIHMVNVKTKKESIFNWKERKVGVSLSKREFKKSSLK